jgi:hypothetical protein
MLYACWDQENWVIMLPSEYWELRKCIKIALSGKIKLS